VLYPWVPETQPTGSRGSVPHTSIRESRGRLAPTGCGIRPAAPDRAVPAHGAARLGRGPHHARRYGATERSTRQDPASRIAAPTSHPWGAASGRLRECQPEPPQPL